jgi:acetyl-CoA C-acetyltransferase
VKIVGSASATDTFMLQERANPLIFNAVVQSTQRAMEQAGVSRDDIDLFELHDAYTIFSVLTLEAAGYAEAGQGTTYASQIGLNGTLPISTFGGLKSRGHPAGATGVYQAVEAALQLRGEAGTNQVTGAKIAMIQCLGGVASTAITHILQI